MKKLLLLLSLCSSLVSFGQCSQTIDQTQLSFNLSIYGADPKASAHNWDDSQLDIKCLDKKRTPSNPPLLSTLARLSL